MNRMLRLLTTIVLLAGAVFVTACNTMEGVGEDTEDAGEAIQDAAN